MVTNPIQDEHLQITTVDYLTKEYADKDTTKSLTTVLHATKFS
jgi:hypothetical protein